MSSSLEIQIQSYNWGVLTQPETEYV